MRLEFIKVVAQLTWKSSRRRAGCDRGTLTCTPITTARANAALSIPEWMTLLRACKGSMNVSLRALQKKIGRKERLEKNRTKHASQLVEKCGIVNVKSDSNTYQVKSTTSPLHLLFADATHFCLHIVSTIDVFSWVALHTTSMCLAEILAGAWKLIANVARKILAQASSNPYHRPTNLPRFLSSPEMLSRHTFG